MSILGAVAGIAGAASSIFGGNKAADAQERAARDAANLNKRIYNNTIRDFTPYREGGENALAAYMSEMGLGERPEGYTGFEGSPGFGFALDQGMDALESSAAARGGLNSGATLQALEDRRMGMAQQDWGNHLNRLAGLTNMGTAAAANTANTGQNYVTGATNALSNIGNAQAANSVNTSNAINAGLNTALQGYQNWQAQQSNPYQAPNPWGQPSAAVNPYASAGGAGQVIY